MGKYFFKPAQTRGRRADCGSCSDRARGAPRQTPAARWRKLFFFVTDAEAKKLECLPLKILSSQVLKFEGKARANPIGGPCRCFLLGKAPGAASKC